MVLKSLVASTIEEGEEEDVYLRKCNIRKSRRQNEKSRKVAIQINEQLRYSLRSSSARAIIAMTHIFYVSYFFLALRRCSRRCLCPARVPTQRPARVQLARKEFCRVLSFPRRAAPTAPTMSTLLHHHHRALRASAVQWP